MTSVSFWALLGCSLAGSAGCGAPGDVPWRTVHQSTFRQVADFGPKVAHVFDGGRRALVADNAWENRRLFLVDLETERVTTIALPDPGRLSIRRFVHGGDCVYAVFSTPGADRAVVYRVDASAGLVPVEAFHRSTFYTDDRPEPGADDLVALQREGRLGALVELRTMVRKADPVTGELSEAGEERVRFFAGEGAFVETNIAADVERLRRSALRVVVDGAAHRSVAPGPGWSVALERARPDGAHGSDADGRIVSVSVTRDGRTTRVYQAGEGRDLFYWACRVGGRLFLVGTSVWRLDVDAAVPPASRPAT